MKTLRVLGFCIVALTAVRIEAEDLLDRIDEALTFSAFQDRVRTRLSGTLALEGYSIQQPAPGIIDTTRDTLFNPRLTLFLDAQLGSEVYLFVQSRADRGFDPSDGGAAPC